MPTAFLSSRSGDGCIAEQKVMTECLYVCACVRDKLCIDFEV